LEAAEAVTEDRGSGVGGRGPGPLEKPIPDPRSPIPVLDGLSSLINKSLVQQREMADGEPRFLMLETIREYAVERLEERGELDGLRRAHAGYFLELAERALPLLRGPEQTAWLDCLEREHDNFRSALEWCNGTPGAEEAGLRLAAALWPFWWRR